VGASLDVMESDALGMRGKRPFVFTNIRAGEGVAAIARFILEKGGLQDRLDLSTVSAPFLHHG
jgi:urease accessory protein